MPRPSQIDQKRRKLLPIVARAFADLGYRRATTAELAQRCGVQENILYRLWPDKKAMFIAAISYVYDLSIEVWKRLLVRTDGARTSAQKLLDYEAGHHGEFGHYRIVFAGLSETDDAEIQSALASMYRHYQQFVREQLAAHERRHREHPSCSADLAAWALVGLGTVANIGRELGLLNVRQRRQLFADVGRLLLNASVA